MEVFEIGQALKECADDPTHDSHTLFHTAWCSDATAALREQLRCLDLLPKCFCHLMCTRDFPVTTSDSDVYALSNYSGSELFERGFKRILRDPDLFWNSEINDLIKKGALTAIAKIKLEELESICQETTVSFQQLQTATQALVQVKGAVRSQRMGPVLDKFAVARPVFKLSLLFMLMTFLCFSGHFQ